MIQKTELLLAKEERFAAVVSESAKPNDAKETLEFAARCYHSKQYAIAVRLFAAAIGADPAIATNMDCAHRYNAACSAVLAAGAKTAEPTASDAASKSQRREQALEWLSADLAHREKEACSATSEGKAKAQSALEHWKADPDLAGVRGHAALEALAAEERGESLRLWEKVASVIDGIDSISQG